MSSIEWGVRTLGSCAKFLSGGTPDKSRSEFWEGDIPWVSSGEMAEPFISDTSLKISQEAATTRSKLVPPKTVLVVVRGMSLAKDFRVALTKREVAFNQDLKALICVQDVDPEFLFYALRGRRNYIRDLATEASHGTKKLESNVLTGIKLKVPGIAVQKRVVEIIAAYDDLIENNRRRIGLLEEVARLLYREWFVHFRFPGHEHVKITNGLPDGWERKTFDDACQAVGGGTPSTAKPEYWNDGDIPWYTPTDITRNSCLALLDSATKITEAGLRESSAKMLPTGTVLMTSRASVGFFGIIDVPSCTNQGFISIMPKKPYLRMYLLQNLMYRVEEIRSNAGGSTYKEISRGKFKALPVVVPAGPLLCEFEEQVSDIHAQVRVLHGMNKRLADARDLLLPRLMNGEIAV